MPETQQPENRSNSALIQTTIYENGDYAKNIQGQ